MYCKNCGKEVSDDAVVCINCGVPPKNGKNFCNNCGAVISPDDKICVNCGSRVASIIYAGFWRRLAALIVDNIVLMPVVLILYFTSPSPDIFQDSGVLSSLLIYELISILVPWLYFALMESSSYQATVGKMALGIIVTDLNGNRISFGKASGRYFGKIVSTIILGIGFLMAGTTQKKQALHDMIAGSLVIIK